MAKAKPTKVKKFTVLQQRFVDEMVGCGIGARAARLAGYSVDACRQQAAENMAIPSIRDAVEKGRAKLAATVHFNAEAVLRELAVLATTEVASELIDDEGWLNGNLKDLSPEVRACISSLECNDQGGVKIKFYDRIKALQLAGKHKAVRAYTEEVEVADALSARLDRVLRERETHAE